MTGDMTVFIAFLRAVNVGGSGKLPMADLRALCEDAGFSAVRTYIASGNVVFHSDASEAEVGARLHDRLRRHMGAPIDVMVRDAEELAALVTANPFPEAPGNTVTAILLPSPPPPDALTTVKGQDDERIVLGRREIYVCYGDAGMGRSRLRIPAAEAGTARNMNTLTKLAEMARLP